MIFSRTEPATSDEPRRRFPQGKTTYVTTAEDGGYS